MKRRHSKYYKTILAVYLIIITVYTSLLVGIFTYYSYTRFSTMYENDKQTISAQVRESIDSRMMLEESTTRQITNNQSFFDAVYGGSYLDKIIFSRELSHICGYFTNYGCKITVLYGAGSGNAISPAYVGGKKEFYDDMQFAEEDISRIDDYLLNGTYKDLFVVASRPNGERMITVFNKLRTYAECNVVFCYSYSYNYILDNTYSGNNEVSIFYNGDILVTNGRAENLDIRGLGEAVERMYPDSADGTVSAVIGGERYKLYTEKSEVNDWIYVLSVPDAERRGVVKRIALISICIFLIAIAIGSFIIKQLTEMVYTPVKKLVKNAEFDEDGQEDEFELLNRAIDTGKSRYNELQRYINVNNEAKESFVKNLLSSSYPVRSMRENMEKYSLSWLDSECFIVVFGIVNVGDLRSKLGDENFYNVRDEIVEMLEERIKQTHSCVVTRISSERIAMIVSGSRSSELERSLVEQISRIEYSTSVEIRIFISEVINKAEDIGRAYYKLSEKVGSGLMYSRAILDTGASQGGGKQWYYPIELEKTLIENTLSASRESVKLALERLFEENFTQNSAEKDNTQLIFAVTATVNRILQILGTDSETVFGSNIKIYNELALCSLDSDMREVIESVFAHICGYIEKQDEKMSRDFAEEMLKFVDENYDRAISLYDIAEKFNYSVNYISRAFKRETGKLFKDYLSMVRVTKAKDMLNSGNYTVTQVAQLVGCSTTNSFIRMFKRCEGITPGQYVETVKKK